MSEIKFPKVTVCPPKNTYTDLNYDLMLADNVRLTEDMINELYQYAIEVVDKHTFMDENAKQRIFSIHREVFWNEPLPEL